MRATLAGVIRPDPGERRASLLILHDRFDVADIHHVDPTG